jgi:tetratricopeptide (TPR) repeat protein
MTWRTNLLGRNQLLNDLLQKMNEPGIQRRLISIQAPGGMGKTRLLYELKARVTDPSKLVTFHDLALSHSRIPLRMESEIVREKNAVEETFWATIAAYENMQGHSQTASVASILDAGSEAFARALCKSGQRLIVLIDTVDLPVSTSASLRRLLGTSLTRLDDIFVILAGRDSHELALEMTRGYEIELLDLPGLDVAPASGFFRGLGVDSVTTRQLVDLAGGRPVLLGLAAEWMESGVPLPHQLVAQARAAGDNLASEDKANQNRLSANFEESLVLRLLDLRGEIDVPLLEMARTPFRYTTSLAAYLHGGTVQAEDTSLQAVARQFYVKTPAPGLVALHDEMRSLINKYVWPIVDPLGTERKHLDLKIAAWYEDELQKLNSTVVDFKSYAITNDALAIESSNQISMKAERQFFLLRHNPGYNALGYLQELKGAIELGQIAYAGLLIEMCRELRSGMSIDNLVELGCIEAEWLRLIGRRQASRYTLEQILALRGIGTSTRLQALLALVRSMKETGDAPAAKTLIDEARALARTMPIEEQARIDLADGERLLSLGLVSEALEKFRVVLALRSDSDATSVTTQAADRAAYASSILGQRDQAEQLARYAINQRQQDSYLTEASASRCTLASIYRDGSRFEDAISEYGKAIDYFYEAGDPYWQATALMERGLCHLLQYEEIWYDQSASNNSLDKTSARPSLAAAGTDLSLSVEFCYTYNREELPKAVHELGHVYWERGDSAKAKELWNDSLKVSLEAGNLRYVLENLIGMCELDIEAGRYNNALHWRREVNPYRERTRKSHALLWSRLRKLEAQAQFHVGDLDLALEGFSEAMPELAQHGGWGRYKLEFELATLGNLIYSLPSSEARMWLNRLTVAWESMYPELSQKRKALMVRALEDYLSFVRNIDGA